MDTTFQIEKFCHIRDNRISVNDTPLFEKNGVHFSSFIKSAYKALRIDYSKFFKMDGLSKLAFMAADVLLKGETEKNVALVFSNKASSLYTDRKHQKTIADSTSFYPSPAVFVYTLPNICMGEISIKHRLYSENAFFVTDKFDPSVLFDYTNSLLREHKAKKVLSGWVDLDNGIFDAFLYVVGEKGTFAHTIEELTRLY